MLNPLSFCNCLLVITYLHCYFILLIVTRVDKDYLNYFKQLIFSLGFLLIDSLFHIIYI